MKNSGFTLIEILITIAILAILTVVAVPSYQKYTLQARIADVLVYADTAKMAFTEYYEETGNCPNAKLAGLKEDHPIPHISSVSSSWDRNPCVQYFEIYLTIDGDSHPSLKEYDDDRVMLKGTFTGNGGISWQCGYSSYTPKISEILPSTCQTKLI